MTDAERALWSRLRSRQPASHRFRRQHVIHPYIVDFVCLDRRLVVEVDGAGHVEHGSYDARRDAFLRQEGFRVLRFSNRDVLTDVEGVVTAIMGALALPPP